MNFENFLKFFPKDQTKSVPEDTITKYRNLLPKTLIDFWKQNGLGTYGNGLIQFINPDEYIDILNDWLLRENDNTRIPFMLSCFGEVYYWRILDAKNSIFDVAYINPHDSSTDVVVYEMEDFFDYLTQQIVIDILKWQPMFGDSSNLLFDNAVKKLGKLQPGEIYFFVPALRIGGVDELQYVEKGDAKVHLDFLLQLVSPETAYIANEENEYEKILEDFGEDKKGLEQKILELEKSTDENDLYLAAKLCEKFPYYDYQGAESPQIKQKYDSKALKNFNQLVQNFSNPKYILERGEFFYYNHPGDVSEYINKAEQDFDKYLEISDDKYRGYMGKIYVAAYSDEWEKIIKYGLLAHEENPFEADPLFWLAGAYKETAQYEKAIQAYEDYKTLNFYNDDMINQNIAEIKILMGEDSQGLDEFQKIFDEADEIGKKGIASDNANQLKNMGRYQDAKKYALLALELAKKELDESNDELAKTEYEMCVLDLAQIQFLMGEKKQALENIKSILSDEKESSLYRREYGDMLRQIGKNNEARKAFEKSINLDPQMPYAQEWLEQTPEEKSFFKKLFGK